MVRNVLFIEKVARDLLKMKNFKIKIFIDTKLEAHRLL